MIWIATIHIKGEGRWHKITSRRDEAEEWLKKNQEGLIRVYVAHEWKVDEGQCALTHEESFYDGA